LLLGCTMLWPRQELEELRHRTWQVISSRDEAVVDFVGDARKCDSVVYDLLLLFHGVAIRKQGRVA
jgi:hypothetical protein